MLFIVKFVEIPCILLTRGKFELTNQDSAGGKIIVSCRQVEIRQLLSLEMTSNIHEKEFTISKTKLVGKKGKI